MDLFSEPIDALRDALVHGSQGNGALGSGDNNALIDAATISPARAVTHRETARCGALIVAFVRQHGRHDRAALLQPAVEEAPCAAEEARPVIARSRAGRRAA